MRWLYYIAVIAGCAAAVWGVVELGGDPTQQAILIGVLIVLASALIGRWELLWLPAAAIAGWFVLAGISGVFTEEDPRNEMTGVWIFVIGLVALAGVELLVAIGVGARVMVREAMNGKPWGTAPR